MGANSGIQWTDHTFNPWIGCTKVSPGCDHCYAEAWASRYGTATWGNGQPRKLTSKSNWNLPLKWNREAEKNGVRYRVFCASLADVFDNEVPDEWRRRLWDLIRATPYLDWLLLTKRIGNAAKMCPTKIYGDPIFSNIWLGISVVNQEEADRDIPKLLSIPARIRFLSMEPLLGPVNLRFPSGATGFSRFPDDFASWPEKEQDRWFSMQARATYMARCELVDWVIVGGESGPGARPMHPDWARSLRDQCHAAGAAFHFKQWGEWACYTQIGASGWTFTREADGRRYGQLEHGDFGATEKMFDGREFETIYPFNTMDQTGPCMVRVGKKAAGRLLDCREWNELPAADR
jgi:protein gp37